MRQETVRYSGCRACATSRVTAPYFHDGRAQTLHTAVETMAQVQLGRKLTDEEIDSIVRFLRTLTGEYRGKTLTTFDTATR